STIWFIRSQFEVHVPNRSVGLPAYEEAQPYLRSNEAGSPHARYAIVEKQSGCWRTKFLSIAYDWENEALLAESRER
ncbi:hypothetical protein ACC695_40820, partial [Rhizobium ruizarguesonis]